MENKPNSEAATLWARGIEGKYAFSPVVAVRLPSRLGPLLTMARGQSRGNLDTDMSSGPVTVHRVHSFEYSWHAIPLRSQGMPGRFAAPRLPLVHASLPPPTDRTARLWESQRTGAQPCSPPPLPPFLPFRASSSSPSPHPKTHPSLPPPACTNLHRKRPCAPQASRSAAR